MKGSHTPSAENCSIFYEALYLSYQLQISGKIMQKCLSCGADINVILAIKNETILRWKGKLLLLYSYIKSLFLRREILGHNECNFQMCAYNCGKYFSQEFKSQLPVVKYFILIVA